MKLPSGWYAFADPKELSRSKPNRMRRFGMDWVVWRNSQGYWIAQRDACPHRSARLSLGKINKNCLICPFHGFRFNDQGVCVHVPEIQRGAPGLKLQSSALVERHGFLWMRWGETQAEGPHWFAELENSEFTYASSRHLWPTHFSRCVENQLDYAHLPFVHAKTIGRGVDPARPVPWVLSAESLRVHLGETEVGTNFFEFRFPNIWRLVVSPKMVQTLMFVPVDHEQTLIYTRSYQRFTRLPILRNLVAWASARLANPLILNEDLRVVLSQTPRDVRSLDLEETLLPSDRAIVAFRKWLSGGG